MADGILLSPFDWERYQSLSRAVASGAREETARLLARGAAWRDPGARSRLEALERRGVTLPALRLRAGLAADAERFADEGATTLAAMDPADVEGLLVEASATAEPVELPVPIGALLARFSTAPLASALGGREHGVRHLSPYAVRDAAALLDLVEIDDYPPRQEDEDELARAVLRDLLVAYARAAEAGWAMRVVL
jgi:hypothetical protein